MQEIQHLNFTPVSGWTLISGQLDYNGPTLEATLFFEQENGVNTAINLPVTLKGRLHEVVKIPKSKKLNLKIKSTGKTGNLESIKIEKLSWPTARYLMGRRLYNTYTTSSPRQRRVLNLNPVAMLLNPYSAYQLIGKGRYFTASPCYDQWIKQSENFTPSVARRLKKAIKHKKLTNVKINVVIDARFADAPGVVQQSLTSLRQQLEMLSASVSLLVTERQKAEWGAVFDVALLTIDELKVTHSENWVLLMQAGTQLAPWALAWLATEMVNQNNHFIYSDHDYWINEKRENPQFKPDWSPELARSSGYIGSAFAMRGHVFSSALKRCGFTSAYDLVLEATAKLEDSAVCHIPAVLFHHAANNATPCRATLARYFERHKINAAVCEQGDFLSVRYGLPPVLPTVSIVVPTRDALHYLKTCVDSLLKKTTWPNFELLVVDNQSCEQATLDYFEHISRHPNVRVLHYNKPFNFSAINNFAVSQANGDVVCLLNNDTEIISPDWLEEMVSRLLQPGTGVVGARLYFSDGRVQHAGDVLGPGGCATHLHGILEGDDPGYMHRAMLAQDLSAVTAACLVTHKALYEQLGGLEEQLTVAFNDVDYCLKVREAGQRVIYTPYAELYHHESVSRGKDDSPEKKARAQQETLYMRHRWGHIIERDPFYNPNLNYSQPDFKLGKIPRVDWPW
ncbi:glycosyltransferase family 2 protein [Oceanimonas sp. AH20CE76]|uniref:glycosyltransferase family 2 protein n=1 Tax=Oceanimonas sp. AH20CE76 TaxID=2977120 RepID=UPI0031FEB159